MKNQTPVPPKKKYEYGYDLAYELAAKQLSEIRDVEERCLKSGAVYLAPRKSVAIAYLNQPCLLDLSGGDVSVESGGNVTVREKLLILHYFLQAKGTPLTGVQVTYKELKEGINYFPVFAKRAISPLVSHFGSDPKKLIPAARPLGGEEVRFGDAAVTINAFPHVPVTLVLWKGDSEFGPEGNIMFDGSVSDYLTNDDIHQLCETIAWKLVRLMKTGGDFSGS